jgi:serine/threonine-protein kinase
MVLQHLQARPVPPSKRTELPIPREMDELVLACLEKDPDKRPRDAQELFLAACRCSSCATWNNDRAYALVGSPSARSDQTARRLAVE